MATKAEITAQLEAVKDDPVALEQYLGGLNAQDKGKADSILAGIGMPPPPPPPPPLDAGNNWRQRLQVLRRSQRDGLINNEGLMELKELQDLVAKHAAALEPPKARWYGVLESVTEATSASGVEYFRLELQRVLGLGDSNGPKGLVTLVSNQGFMAALKDRGVVLDEERIGSVFVIDTETRSPETGYLVKDGGEWKFRSDENRNGALTLRSVAKPAPSTAELALRLYGRAAMRAADGAVDSGLRRTTEERVAEVANVAKLRAGHVDLADVDLLQLAAIVANMK